MLIVPLATVVGAPRLLFGFPPTTLFSEPTLKVTPELPFPPSEVGLVYVFAPLKVIFPLLLALRVKAPLPLITPERVSGAVLLPLFRRFRGLASNDHGPGEKNGGVGGGGRV